MLGERLGALGLADAELEPWEDVEDPAGGDLPVFRSCARKIHELVERLVPELGPEPARDEVEEIA
jgi:hypothetical protein